MAYEGWEKLPGDGLARREGGLLFVDVVGFVSLVHSSLGKVQRVYRRVQIRKILRDFDWVVHYEDKDTGRRVLAEGALYYRHERETAIQLARFGYDVVFAPEGMFHRTDKKFDVFLFKDTVILKADLKNIATKNPDNIAKRIREGSDQASRLVINIVSDIRKKALINGLRSGVTRNKLIKEILLIYKGKLYKISTATILNRHFSLA
jgi:hypothetical protein